MKNLFLGMKTLFIALAVLCVGLPAMADENYTVQVLTAQGASADTTAVNLAGFVKKSVILQGYSSTVVNASLSGTAIVQGGPTTSGPWVTLKDRAANAASATTTTAFDLDTEINFIRLSWTRSGSANKTISGWVIYGN